MNKYLEGVAKLFFKLGSIAFGGFAAHIAIMEDEVVKKRKGLLTFFEYSRCYQPNFSP